MNVVLKRNSNGALIRNAVTGALCSTCCSYVVSPVVTVRSYHCTYRYQDWLDGQSLNDVIREWNTGVARDPGYMEDTLTPWTINGNAMTFIRRITFDGSFTFTPETQEMSVDAGGIIRAAYTPLTAVLTEEQQI